MRLIRSRSFTVSAGLLMTSIVLLALASMIVSMLIAEIARSDAAALNAAGSLRMQSFRLSTYLQIQPDDGARLQRFVQHFEQSLDSGELTTRIPEPASHPLRISYEHVRARWREEMQPAIALAYAEPAVARTRYLAQLDDFVGGIDTMMLLLQQRVESKTQRLRLVQAILFSLTAMLALYAVYRTRKYGLPRVRELGRAAGRARPSNGLPSMPFHAAEPEAADLSSAYRNLEQRIEKDTAALQRSNKALRLLYETAQTLCRAPDTQPDYSAILQRMEQLFGDVRVTLCLSTPDADQAYQRITSCAATRPTFCQAPACAPCFSGTRQLTASGDRPTRHVPIRDAGRSYGVLILEYNLGQEPEDWQLELAETIAGHIAAALGLGHRNEQHRRLALMDERAVIARELHDSLAQALSYLKIQVSRLQALVTRGAAKEEKEEVLTELRNGLSSAYRELRELLSTFRLKINEAGLEPALRSTMSEFAERGGLNIVLDYQLSHCPLTPNEEIHVLQVVREALANIVHHAQARTAEVSLTVSQDGLVNVVVQDDGVGLPDNWQRRNHYGLAIMQERSNSVGGELSIGRRPAGGTEIRMRFPPQIARHNTDNSLLSSIS